MYIIYVISSDIFYLSFKSYYISFMWINTYIEREIFKCWWAMRDACLALYYFSYFIPISKIPQSPLIRLLSVRTNYKKSQTSRCLSNKQEMNLLSAFQVPFTYLRRFQWSSFHWSHILRKYWLFKIFRRVLSWICRIFLKRRASFNCIY
jgi:hypothetical protein